MLSQSLLGFILGGSERASETGRNFVGKKRKVVQNLVVAQSKIKRAGAAFWGGPHWAGPGLEGSIGAWLLTAGAGSLVQPSWPAWPQSCRAGRARLARNLFPPADMFCPCRQKFKAATYHVAS
ncbi:hypothetical protein ABW19_dt0203220 [Dactylella cylindrospora]|nr:hypothetical protein ABW19_dt0203220 [Dactylella cylindrospora]